MISVELYIGNNRLDLFDDENISLNMSIKNLQKIDTVFTDFTQSFTIPASKNNNKALEHWYDNSVTVSFNPAVKIEGRIELNGIPFRNGVYSLDKAVKKNGRIDYYELTFYGSTANLSQLFGDDFLTDLDLSTYKLDYTSFSTALTGRVFSNNVLIPLIGHSKVFNYNDPASDSSSIKYASGTGNDGGIQHIDVKPAITLKAILDAIETKYSVTFNSTFFDSTDFAKMYMWAHREAGKPKNFNGDFVKFIPTTVTDNSTVVTTSYTYDQVNDWFYEENFTISGITAVDYDVYVAITSVDEGEISDVEFTIVAYDENNGSLEWSQSAVGFYNDSISIDTPLPTESDGNLIFGIICNKQCDFTFQIHATWNLSNPSQKVDIDIAGGGSTELGYFHFTDTDYTDPTYGVTTSVNGGLPQQKVKDFLGGLIKMFNLVVDPVSNTEFNIEPLDDYYAAGTETNLTKYVDSSEVSIRPSSLYGQIDFKYAETSTVLGEYFRENNDGVGFGDLRSIIVDSNGDPISKETFSVELPFINLMWSRLSDVASDNELINYVTGAMVDKNTKPLLEQPYIFYYAGQESVTSNPYGTREGATGTLTSRTTYNLCYQWNTNNDSFTGSLNFGSEINTYTLNDGTASTPSLYVDYWKTYITDIYDLAQRRYSFKAVLPMSVINQISLSNSFVINSDKYRINSMQVNLTTGEATLDLISLI